jgi:hypothetical protein
MFLPPSSLTNTPPPPPALHTDARLPIPDDDRRSSEELMLGLVEDAKDPSVVVEPIDPSVTSDPMLDIVLP